MSEEAVKVFISYSWDSSEHKEKVLALSDSLRKHGIDCQIDRYHQSPPQGWYRWMMDQIEESDFVLVVCTEKYNLRYRNKEERGQGRGVTWEGGLIIAELYSEQGINKKYIPVLLSAEGEQHIPRSLQMYTIYLLLSSDDYDLNKQGDYQNLYRHLTKQPAYAPAQLGKPQILLPISGSASTVGDQGQIIQAEDPIIPKETTPITSSNELASEKGVDYTRLQYLLKAKQWQEADRETAVCMYEIMGRQEGDTLSFEDIETFLCTDLRTIDQLWVKHSKGKFGFSVQKKIWQECGSPTMDNTSWVKFGEVVGWKRKGFLGVNKSWKSSYSELTFDASAPLGHFPFRVEALISKVDSETMNQINRELQELIETHNKEIVIAGCMAPHFFFRVEACRL